VPPSAVADALGKASGGVATVKPWSRLLMSSSARMYERRHSVPSLNVGRAAHINIGIEGPHDFQQVILHSRDVTHRSLLPEKAQGIGARLPCCLHRLGGEDRTRATRRVGRAVGPDVRGGALPQRIGASAPHVR